MLSEPAARDLLHLRDITLRGYRRADGLFDVEAHLADTKSYGFDNDDRGRIEAGEELHGMWMRMTFDRDLLITGFEAVTEHSPYAVCPAAADNFTRLVGLRIGRGFLKAVAERVGGTKGCTHLRELMQQMATVAIQTLYSQRQRRAGPDRIDPMLLNTCHAYADDGELVARRWPELARAKQPA